MTEAGILVLIGLLQALPAAGPATPPELPAIDAGLHCRSLSETALVDDCLAREDTALTRLQTSWPDFSETAQDHCTTRVDGNDIETWSGLEACLVIASLNAPRRAPSGTIALQSASPESQPHVD